MTCHTREIFNECFEVDVLSPILVKKGEGQLDLLFGEGRIKNRHKSEVLCYVHGVFLGQIVGIEHLEEGFVLLGQFDNQFMESVSDFKVDLLLEDNWIDCRDNCRGLYLLLFFFRCRWSVH